MADLCAHFESLGFANAESFIASGNIIFETRAASTGAMEKKIGAHLRKALGYEVPTFIRGVSEVAGIAGYKPFSVSVLKSAKTVNVAFLAEPPSAEAVAALMKHQCAESDFHVHGREVYWACKTGQSDSAFFRVGFDKALKMPTTVRNLNTIARLADLYAPGAV
jgi:uncharacterized protein (DUF1697 family)